MSVLYFIQFSLLLSQMQLMFLKSYFNFKLKNCQPLKSVSKKNQIWYVRRSWYPNRQDAFPSNPTSSPNIYLCPYGINTTPKTGDVLWLKSVFYTAQPELASCFRKRSRRPYRLNQFSAKQGFYSGSGH